MVWEYPTTVVSTNVISIGIVGFCHYCSRSCVLVWEREEFGEERDITIFVPVLFSKFLIPAIFFSFFALLLRGCRYLEVSFYNYVLWCLSYSGVV